VGVEVIRSQNTDNCSDTFVGTYALEYVRQKQRAEPWDIRRAVERGCRAAAKTCEQLGAQESIPWADEIDVESVNGV
jgi:ribokinase